MGWILLFVLYSFIQATQVYVWMLERENEPRWKECSIITGLVITCIFILITLIAVIGG